MKTRNSSSKEYSYSKTYSLFAKLFILLEKMAFLFKNVIHIETCDSYSKILSFIFDFHVIIIRLTCDLYSETTFTFDNFTWVLADFIGNMNCDLIYIVVWKGFIGWPPTEWIVLGWKLWNKSNFIFSFSNFFFKW